MSTKRAPQPTLPKIPCDGPGCPRYVRQTRPSKSGLHFCDEPKCQAARQREYQARRKKKHEETLLAEHMQALNNYGRQVIVITNLMRIALHEPRVHCEDCGLPDAITGYPHPGRDGGPCYGTGQTVQGVTAEQVKAIWPDPEHADV
jgi:hypothetical protein